MLDTAGFLARYKLPATCAQGFPQLAGIPAESTASAPAPASVTPGAAQGTRVYRTCTCARTSRARHRMSPRTSEAKRSGATIRGPRDRSMQGTGSPSDSGGKPKRTVMTGMARDDSDVLLLPGPSRLRLAGMRNAEDADDRRAHREIDATGFLCLRSLP